MKFYAGRISILSTEYSLFHNSFKGNAFDLVIEALSKNSEYNAPRNINLVIEPILNDEEELIGGKLGKAAETDIPLNNGGNLEKVHAKIHPYIHYIIMKKEQLIFFEYDSKNFYSTDSVLNYMSAFLTSKLFPSGFEVKMEPLTIKGAFWDIFEESDSVFEVEFKLITPNLLGQSYKEMKEILNKEREESNARTIIYGMENIDGDLKLSNEGKYKHILSWIEDGAGKWKVKRRITDTSDKESISSDKKRIKFFESEFKTIDTNEKTLEQIKKQLEFGEYKVVGDDIDH